MTALQELISYFETNINDCEEFGLPGRGFYIDCKNKARELLPKNEKEIKNAFDNGRYNAHSENPFTYITGEEYYEKEFLNK